MRIKIKKLYSEAVIPEYAHDTDACFDLTSVYQQYDQDGNIIYGTGLAMEIPEGHVGLIFPRSSISKKNVMLTNSVGVIDCGYTGEITFKFKPVKANQYDSINTYQIGDRIGQMMIIPYPKIEFEEVDELSKTERGDGGYGSTGN